MLLHTVVLFLVLYKQILFPMLTSRPMFDDKVSQHTSQVCVLSAEMFLVYVIIHICCRVLSCREMVCVQKVLQQVYLAMHVRLRAGVCLCACTRQTFSVDLHSNAATW